MEYEYVAIGVGALRTVTRFTKLARRLLVSAEVFSANFLTPFASLHSWKTGEMIVESKKQ
jgi:hypothetical protein